MITVTLNPALDHTLHVPGFATGRVNRATGEEVHAGGKGVNVAAVLAGLGAEVAVTGVLGGENAEAFEVLFGRLRIIDQFVRTAGRTRTGIKIVDTGGQLGDGKKDGGGETTDINFPGPTVSCEAIAEVRRRVLEGVEPGTWVVLAGNVPAGVDPGVYGEWIDAVHERGGRAAIDTSGEPLRRALRHRPDFAKPNADELSDLLGRALMTFDDRVAAARLLVTQFGMRCAAISLGGDGAIFVDSLTAIAARPPVVAVRSTVGAGDSMVAGAVLGLSRGDLLQDIATLATALGADAVTRVGVGIDAAQSFKLLRPQVRTEVIY